MLLEELQHRIANSLQIIASIILLKARTVQSEETRIHLQDAHKRVMSIAAVQQQLMRPGHRAYRNGALSLKTVRDAGDLDDRRQRPITLKVVGEGGSATSRQAESLGLIVTELVMNALKHAFPDEKLEGQITVAYDVDGTNWKLSVSDNGIGKPDGVLLNQKPGSAPASSRRSRNSSMPRLKPWPA